MTMERETHCFGCESLRSEIADLRQQLAAFGDDPGQRIQELAAENECLQRRLAAIKKQADKWHTERQSDWSQLETIELIKAAKRLADAESDLSSIAYAQTRIEPEPALPRAFEELSKEDEHAHSRD